MCGENGGDVDMAFATERDGETSLPFVEVGDNGGGELTRHILAKEPRDEVPKDDRLVRLVVIRGAGDACEVPEIGFPLV